MYAPEVLDLGAHQWHQLTLQQLHVAFGYVTSLTCLDPMFCILGF